MTGAGGHMGRGAPAPAGALLAVAALALSLAGGARGGCGVAEWACRAGGACLRLDQYCDGRAQCPDGSDEPAGCSQCNRTYYGRAGQAYALAVRGAPSLPFLCHLTFTAGGGAHGDLVQLAFDEFRVGRYDAGAPEPCPDGFMQLAELGRPFTGGSWCGAADGAALYYSETSTVTVSVKLFRARLGEPFGFQLRYKFLSRGDAVVRFGPPAAPLERGSVAPGTYCTRTYEECHRKACKLQSPNYPGMYPRNVTCYWSLRQKDIPTCKHAMISVRQEYSHKMQIKRSIAVASMNKTGRAVRAWRECTGERDRLLVYDGASTDDPLLLAYCGGDWLPPVTARGPDMLVAFHSAPFAAPPPAARAAAPLRGFELDVSVVFADSDSLDYAREARRCEFHVKASSAEEESNATAAGGPAGAGAALGAGRGRRGVVRAPAHTLPPNTTCTWTFHGRQGDLVWLYFSSFTHYSLVESRRTDSGERDEESTSAAPAMAKVGPTAGGGGGPCAVELRVWDGGGDGEAARLLGHYCDAAPALCARAALANATRVPRPCAPPDGYVSTSSVMSLAAHTLPGTATHPLGFALHYEFSDARLEGAAWGGGAARAEPAACARLVDVPGALASPRHVLWFGRGGARRLRCVYRVGAAGARVALRLQLAAFGRRGRCATRADARSGRSVCVPLPPPDGAARSLPPLEPDGEFDEDDEASLVPHLWIYESPWPGYRVPLACLCDNSSAPLALAGAGALELELAAGRLEPTEDHRHVRFLADWSREPSACAARRRSPPPGAMFHLTFPYDNDRASECGETPFLLAARGNRSAWLRVWGDELAPTAADGDPPPCHTTNRVLVYDAQTSRLVKAICPSADSSEARAHSVQVFSGNWRAGDGGAALLLVWAGREAGSARAVWMEVWRAATAVSAPPANVTALCDHPCAALAACMDGALWCDGVEHCPGGADEAGGARCGGARLLAALTAPGVAGALAGGAAALAAGALLAALWLRRRGAPDKALGALAAGRRLTEELLFDASRASTAS